MPSPALGTLAISSVVGGQEGYDLAPSPNGHSTRSQSSDHNTTSLRHNSALQPLDTRAANTLSSATTIDVNNLDGAQEQATEATGEGGLRTSLHIDPAIQDSPAHDFHVHTEAANEAHAQLKKELEAQGGKLHNMSAAESPGGAQSAVAAQASLENTLDEMEKNTAGGPEEGSAHIERTVHADEKPGQIATASDATAATAAATTPLPNSQPSTTTPESTQAATTPALNITLLLPTGARHAFRITESYLTKRGVSIPGTDDKGNKDVFSISIYQIKELILREWKEEWGGETTVGPPPAGSEVEEVEEGRMRGKPSSPAAIRLIFFGRLLGDGDKAEGKPTPTSLLNALGMDTPCGQRRGHPFGRRDKANKSNRLQIQQDIRKRGTHDNSPARCG